MTNSGVPLNGLERLTGEVVVLGDAGYDEARTVHSTLVDKKPAVVVTCHSDADVVAALAFARENNLEISVKGGGHNVNGFALTDGGVMLNLSGLADVQVDKDAGLIRVGGGALWGGVASVAQEHGLAVAGGSGATVGVGGFTLGGGHGILSPRYGLAADNVVSYNIVTADGQVLTVTEDDHSDLFWALRGGGGNFGVVTEFTFRARPLGQIFAGGIIYSMDAAVDALRFWRDFTSKGISDDATAWAFIMTAPGGGMQMLMIGVFHLGTEEEARKEFEPLLNYGTPMMVQVGMTGYREMLEQEQHSGANAPGQANYVKSHTFRELPDEALEIMIREFADTPTFGSVLALEHYHGESSRIPVGETAVTPALRKDGYNLMAASLWADPADNEVNIAWIRRAFDAVKPYFDEFPVTNYVGLDETDDPSIVNKVYGPNYDRLVEVKKAYDPENVFHRNINVPPAK